MILVDASVWIDHFRVPDRRIDLLSRVGTMALHPFTLGELLLGGLPRQGRVLDDLTRLVQPPLASAVEMHAFIAWAELANTGIGYVDANLLLSARIGGGSVLTNDKRLRAQAERLGVMAELD